MRKIFSIFAAMLCAVAVNATIRNITPTQCFEGGRNDGYTLYVELARGAQAGDTIVLADGTYMENQSIPVNNQVVVMAAEGAHPVVVMNGYFQIHATAEFKNIKFQCKEGGQGYCMYFYDNTNKYLKLDGCEFQDFTQYCVSSWEAYHIDSCIVNNCYFHDLAKAPFYFAPSSLENDVNACDNLTVNNCTFANITLADVAVLDLRNNNNNANPTSKLRVDHCTFYNCKGYERMIQAYKSPDVLVSNCIMMNPLAEAEEPAIYATYLYGGDVKNCVWFQTKRVYTKKEGGAVDNQNVDPLFVDAANGNFTLGEGSPALTAAEDGGAIGDPRWVPAAAPALPYVALLGEMNDWDGAVNQLVPAEDGLTASATVSLAMNNNSGYAFKLLVGSDVLSAHHDGSDWYGIGRNAAPVELNWNADNSDPIWLSMDVAGDYIFTYTFASNTLAITYPEIQHTYTVAGGKTDLFGTSWDPTNTANDMTKQEDGTYKWEKTDLTLAAGSIGFKVCEDHAWAVAYPAQDYQLAIPEAGIYTITITFNPAAEADKVAAVATKTGDAVVIPTVAMHGNFLGSWADTENFTLAEGNATASLTLNLAADQYEFGMRIGGSDNWTANGATLTREANSTDVSVGSGNMKLTADVAGDYIFTYTFETHTLAVTFPIGTGITNTAVDAQIIKTIENGQLIIIKNGVKYDVHGTIIR